MTPADQKTRDRLKEIRGQIQDLRSQRAEAKKERDSAKEAFGNADLGHDVKVTETEEFKNAEQAVAKLGGIDDQIADLSQAESGILRLLGEDAERQGSGNHPAMDNNQVHGWDGKRMLQGSSDYRDALDRGLFSSSGRFGTVELGQVAGREEFLAALPSAPAGNVGTDQGGVVPDVRGIIAPFLKPLQLLDLIPTGTTDSNIIQYVQVTALPGYAAETAELALKPQEGLTLVDATAPVRTIAGYVKMARQAMEDVAGLGSLINTLLPYDVRRRVENQILLGDGTGQNILGIYNTSGIGAPASATGDNVMDGILRAITTIVLSDAEPDFVTLNPTTFQNMAITKASGSGEYMYELAGQNYPSSMVPPTIWGLTVTRNRLVPQANPLVGDSRGAMLLVREGVTVKTSDSDQDDFIRNRVTLLAETRVAFPVWRPTAFAKAPLG